MHARRAELQPGSHVEKNERFMGRPGAAREKRKPSLNLAEAVCRAGRDGPDRRRKGAGNDHVMPLRLRGMRLYD